MSKQSTFKKDILLCIPRCFKTMLLFVMASNLLHAQTTVIMPHQGSDTLFITDTGCYTILDPGGLGKYSNNEDSYLYLVSNASFYLDIEYETGHQDDGKDWLRIYYDTTLNTYSEYMCGIGTCNHYMWNSRALLHFHSNSYNTFEGFTIRVRHVPSMYNYQFTVIDTNSVQLTWDESRNDATSWTVYYRSDEDTTLSVQTNTTTVTLNNLTNDRYYQYYIINDKVACINIEYQWFASQMDSTILMMRPNYGTNDTLPAGTCYRLKGSSGDTLGLSFGWTETNYYFNNGHGVYLQGTYQVNPGEVQPRWQSMWDNAWRGDYFYSWDNEPVHTYYQWFPRGVVNMVESNRVFYNFEVLPENSSYITPTISSITATSATVSWTDAMNSTSYTFKYCKEEGQWTQLQTTSPTVTLNGLDP